MMSESLIIVGPVVLCPAIVVAVAMKAMAVIVMVAVVVVVVAVALAIAVAVAVAAVIMNREILVRQPRTRQCMSSMARPTPRAKTVDGTVATVTIRQAAIIYPA